MAFARYIVYGALMAAVGAAVNITGKQLLAILLADLFLGVLLVIGMPTKREIERAKCTKCNPRG